MVGYSTAWPERVQYRPYAEGGGLDPSEIDGEAPCQNGHLDRAEEALHRFWRGCLQTTKRWEFSWKARQERRMTHRETCTNAPPVWLP